MMGVGHMMQHDTWHIRDKTSVVSPGLGGLRDGSRTEGGMSHNTLPILSGSVIGHQQVHLVASGPQLGWHIRLETGLELHYLLLEGSDPSIEGVSNQSLEICDCFIQLVI